MLFQKPQGRSLQLSQTLGVVGVISPYIYVSAVSNNVGIKLVIGEGYQMTMPLGTMYVFNNFSHNNTMMTIFYL